MSPTLKALHKAIKDHDAAWANFETYVPRTNSRVKAGVRVGKQVDRVREAVGACNKAGDIPSVEIINKLRGFGTCWG